MLQVRQFLHLDYIISHKIFLFFSQITIAKLLFQVLSITNHGAVWILLGPSLIWISWLHEMWGNSESLLAIESHRLQFLAFCFVVDLLVVGITKVLMRRSRPSYGAHKPSNSSFPSGHSSRSAILLFLWLSDSYGSETLWTFRSFIVIFWCLLMGIARISLGKHFLSDVTVGYIIGMLEAFTLASVARNQMGLFQHDMKWSEWWRATCNSNSLNEFFFALMGKNGLWTERTSLQGVMEQS